MFIEGLRQWNKKRKAAAAGRRLASNVAKEARRKHTEEAARNFFINQFLPLVAKTVEKEQAASEHPQTPPSSINSQFNE